MKNGDVGGDSAPSEPAKQPSGRSSPTGEAALRGAAAVCRTRRCRDLECREIRRRRPTPTCVCPTCDTNALLNPVVIVFCVGVLLLVLASALYWASPIPDGIADWRSRWYLYTYSTDALMAIVSFVAVAVGVALTRGTEIVQVQEQAVAALQTFVNANSLYSRRVLLVFYPWLRSAPSHSRRHAKLPPPPVGLLRWPPSPSLASCSTAPFSSSSLSDSSPSPPLTPGRRSRSTASVATISVAADNSADFVGGGNAPLSRWRLRLRLRRPASASTTATATSAAAAAAAVEEEDDDDDEKSLCTTVTAASDDRDRDRGGDRDVAHRTASLAERWSEQRAFRNQRAMFESVAFDILFQAIEAVLGAGAVPTADFVRLLRRLFSSPLVRNAWRAKRPYLDTSTQLFVESQCFPVREPKTDGSVDGGKPGVASHALRSQYRTWRAGQRSSSPAGGVGGKHSSSSPAGGVGGKRSSSPAGGVDNENRRQDCACGGCCKWRGRTAGCGCIGRGGGTCCYGCNRNSLLHPVSIIAFCVLALFIFGSIATGLYMATHALPDGATRLQQWEVYFDVAATLLLAPTLLLVVYAYVDTQHQTSFADTLAFVALQTAAWENYPHSVAFYRQLRSCDPMAQRVQVPPPPPAPAPPSPLPEETRAPRSDRVAASAAAHRAASLAAAERLAYRRQQQAFVATYSDAIFQSMSSRLQVDTIPDAGKRTLWQSYWRSADLRTMWRHAWDAWPPVLADYVRAHYYAG